MRVSDAHRRLTAWLGLLAIWLGVVMPVASQSIRSLQSPVLETTVCLADGHDQHVLVPLDDNHDGGHMSHSGWQACGYCGLLALHLPVSAAPPHAAFIASHLGPAAIDAAPVIDLPRAHTPAAPRAPPSIAA